MNDDDLKDYEKNKEGLSPQDEDIGPKDIEPIDGQMGIEELFVREEFEGEKNEDEVLEPIDNQISFEEFESQSNNSQFENNSKKTNFESDVNSNLNDNADRGDISSLSAKNFEDDFYLQDYTSKTNNLQNQNYIDEDRKALDDFFKTDEEIKKEEQTRQEKEELNKFFEGEEMEDDENKNFEDDTYLNSSKNDVENNEEDIQDENATNEEDIQDEKIKEDIFVKEEEKTKNNSIEQTENNLVEDEEVEDNSFEDTEDTEDIEDTEEEIEDIEDTEENVDNEEDVNTNESGEDMKKKSNKKSVNLKAKSTSRKTKIEGEKVEAQKPNKKSLAEEEKFFLNDDNSQMVKDVEKINSEVGEVDLSVGKDAFADYVSSELKTQKVEEEDAVEVKEKIVSENSGEDVVDGMLYKNLDTVLHESMIPYSEHVILDRAIPRVEDGLKPVQRRILYSMIELGVTPDKPFRKSARIVGDCLGKYHPHGDSSVYDAMVRLAQPFSTNMILVEGHGNFGSVDGDGAAAMRYTEARLAPLALELLRDLDKNTVRWGLNFDDTLKEPEILPGRFPNLLVNGSTGIAVGLATNIPPHNLAETIDGVTAYIDNPNITLKEMMRIIKGPDFPTGGFILNSSELKEAYETGKGKIYIRAKMHIESNNNDKKYIVITELPYQVNKSALLQKINSFKEEDRYGLGVISEVRDESDREGLRAVIRLKKDANVKKVYESLIKYTELQVTFGVNMVAIANGKPKQMSLMDIISYYTEYQREIILRRSKYECEQAKEREHILSGLLIAIKNIDAVVKIIKTSKNTTEAKSRLRAKFFLSEKQAQAILDMRLARLTSLEVFKLEEEIKKLRELIAKLTKIINSKNEQLKVVKEELNQIKREHKRERKTKLLKTDDTLKIAEEPETPKELPSQNMVILKNAKGNFKCMSQKHYNLASKEITDASTLFDTHVLKFEVESTKTILAFSSLGNCFKVTVKDFGESRFKDKGINERSIFKELVAGETIVALFDFDLTTTKENLLFLTKDGMIKKTPFSEYGLLKKYYQAMKLKEGDEILQIVKEPQGEYCFMFVTKGGMVLRAENKDVPIQGRVSGGVKGMAFTGNDRLVCAQVTNDEGELIVITDKGQAKKVLITNIDKMVRYRKGLKIMILSNETGKQVVYASTVREPFSVVCEIGNSEELYTKNTDLIPIETRIGKGKPLNKSKKNMGITNVYSAI